MRNLVDVQVEIVCARASLAIDFIVDVCLPLCGLRGIAVVAAPDGDHEVL